jgi:DNA mismatch repair ATPase MutS
MKTFLMYKDRDFNLQQNLPANEEALMQDLELETLFNAMALGDEFIFEVAKKAVIGAMNTDLETIRYRQGILKDCLKNSAIVRDIYQIPIESMKNKKKHWYSIFSSSPSALLANATELMQMFVGLLIKLKNIADENADKFESEGFARFFAMIRKELEDEYIEDIQDHLRELKFREGVLISAELGEGNEGNGYMLRKAIEKKQRWIKRVLVKKPPVYSFSIHPRDEAGARALSELKTRGINLAANALGQSADHIDNFFKMLQVELAFYIGCLNLYEQLEQIDEPISFPRPATLDERRHFSHGLYDVCLALTMKQKIIGNDVNADDKDLVIITGANQGGKSTFLRSMGLAQLMMQCGMFVPAEFFCSNICDGLFTHYQREEDAAMESGKLDEELVRMSVIADNIRENSLLLFNESFAATNEREGSEIARQITRALVEKRIKVFFVTHLYEFAHALYKKDMENTIFLRAERQADGTRTFKVVEGAPLETSYGEDLYRAIWFDRDSS